MTTLIHSMPELLAAIRLAVQQRNISYETLDAIAGVPARYCSKILAPVPTKNCGITAFGDVMGAIGKALLLIDDPQQIQRVKSRWTPRKKPLKASVLASGLSMTLSEQISPELAAQIELREYMKRLGQLGGKKGGSKGGKRRAKVLGKRARQRAASHAARMRWAREANPPAGPTHDGASLAVDI